MKSLRTNFTLAIAIYKYALKFFRAIAGFFASIKIQNWLSFFAAVLGFIGTFVIVMDNFEFISNRIDKFQKFQNISIALNNLNSLNTTIKDGQKVGMIRLGSQGFSELIDIVIINRPAFRNKQIVAIAKNQPLVLADIPFNIVHIFIANETHAVSLTTEYIFDEWVSNYRDKYFLKFGLSLITIGFLIGVLGHIKRKKAVTR